MPSYPVCLHVYGPLNYYECPIPRCPQCNTSASGRAAQCIVNPYFAKLPNTDARWRATRHRDVY